MRTDLYQGHDYYLLDDLLTEEHKLIRETARAWVKKEVSPIIEDAAEQILRIGVAGIERGAAKALAPGGGFPRGGREFDFGEPAVLRQRKDAAHVAEAGSVRTRYVRRYAAEMPTY